MHDLIRRDRAGFRLRGLQTTRLETFTDAAFAFALTLLVISLDPPTALGDLQNALLNVPVFLLSASMLMMFWWGHHSWSRRYGLDDAASGILTCFLVFTVLIYVYPLRFVFSLMMAWIGQLTGIRLTSGVQISGPQDVNTVFAIYSAGFILMAVAIMLLNVHAWRQRENLELDEIERHETRAMIGAWTILTVTGVVALLVALFTPATMFGLPGWVFGTLGVIMPLYRKLTGRRRPATPAVPAPAEVAV